ncbi:hypothetical protein [Tropicimonas sp. IMCC6043]|uniref:hypothetical protein n=1 Tax=Tropicimonas sp. IMCC6043 TaxID=2510645 RepID=UPI00101C16B0|nr:hypothetical protein [Tropicimonas sp. IMCC6043]RYH08131.1 hypothetical protein EU800_17720 [Tropicimonas sp. IMCC6043]
MSDTDSHPTPEETPEPFTGDRGWKGLKMDTGEGAFFALVVVLLVVAVLVGLTMGMVGIGLVFVALTFASLAVLVVISVGQ